MVWDHFSLLYSYKTTFYGWAHLPNILVNLTYNFFPCREGKRAGAEPGILHLSPFVRWPL